MYHHISVLLKETLELLSPGPNQNFVDATLGGGGYTKSLLSGTKPNGKVLSIDLDKDAIENFQFPVSSFQNRLTLVHGNFRDIAEICAKHTFINIQGIVADIGFSSYELDQAGRGISFQKSEPLDMRFDTHGNSVDAAFIINNWNETQILQIIKEYGEEPFARQITKGILRARQSSHIRMTEDLVEIIRQSLPKPVAFRWQSSTRRVFQALRIAVNNELENLELFLQRGFDILNAGGRLAVVTFHSLEDRIVKRYFVGLTKGCVCPLDFPQCVCGKTPQGKLLTKKPVIPSVTEMETNPRSKSAKLRVIEKI